MKNEEKIPFFDYIDQVNRNTNNSVMYKDELYSKLKKQAKFNLTYNNIFNRLKNIVLKMYKWKTPENINPRIMELGLLYSGMLCAFNGPKGQFILPCLPMNRYTVYGDPTQVRVYGFNGFNESVNIKYNFESPMPMGVKLETPTNNEGIFMRDNDCNYPYINYVREFALKLTDEKLALNIAFQRLKSPFIYIIDEHELKDTVKTIADKVESNDDVIIRLKSNSLGNKEESIRLEKNDMRPEIITHMREQIMSDFNEFIETIGINTNPNPDKAQYTNTTDSNSNNSLIDIEQDIRYLNREQFCEDCKKIGVDISVEKNIDEVKLEADKMAQELSKGDDYGKDNIDRE